MQHAGNGLNGRSSAWVATFGANVPELRESDALPPAAPAPYPALCDWLTDRLLATIGMQMGPVRLLEDQRDGEVLSVRVELDPSQAARLPRDIDPWWELLELAPREVIYPDQG